jgi:spore maturation protein CgeB
MSDPDWAKVVVYPADEDAVRTALQQARGADLVIKASGVGIFDQLLEKEVLGLKTPSTLVVFWDVDAPATLDRVLTDPDDPFCALIPQYDAIFTYGGGEPVTERYRCLGARECVPIYNGLDPVTHHPVQLDPKFDGHLAFLGNRLPDREARGEEFFLNPAAQLPEKHFLLGGAGWEDKPKSTNVTYFDHVYTRDHNAFNITPLAVLNVSRESMARYGFSPATRVFEAAGAAACLITDYWEGIDLFFEPGSEILIARTGEDVIGFIQSLDRAQAARIGKAAYRRALAEHTYAHRAAQIDAVLNVTPTRHAGAAL